MWPSSTEEEIGIVRKVTEEILAFFSVIRHTREAHKASTRSCRKDIQGFSLVSTENRLNSLPEGRSRGQSSKEGVDACSVLSGVEEENSSTHGSIVRLLSGDAKRCGTIVESLKRGRKGSLGGEEEHRRSRKAVS